MKEQPSANVFRFTWGSLPADALNGRTIRQLRVIANREGTTIEQVMSKALEWCLATPDVNQKRMHKV
jgi:hypothetical protein